MRFLFKVNLLLLLLSACLGNNGAAQQEKLDLELLRSSNQCGFISTVSYAVWISDTDTLQKYIDQIEKNSLGSSPQPQEINFTSEGVLFVTMGQKPTAGYTISLADRVGTIADNIATIRLNWQEPEKDSVTAQVITSPCLFIKIKKGGFAKIRIIDQRGKLRVETTTK